MGTWKKKIRGVQFRRRENWVRRQESEGGGGRGNEAKRSSSIVKECKDVDVGTHRCALYRSCVRSVTGNGFTSVKGDIKKMKNTAELLPTCTGYNYDASSVPSFPSPSTFLSLYTPKWRRGRERESPQNSNHPRPFPVQFNSPWIASQLVLIFRSYRRLNF